MELALSKETIGEVACIIKAQGFQLNNVFYPRELSIANDNINLSFNIDPELNESNLTAFHRNCLKYQTNNIHGISLKPDQYEI
jgi:hypothetical protein